MVLLSALEILPLLTAAFLAALYLVAIKSITFTEALTAVRGRILLTVVAAFGLGDALRVSGIAAWVAQGLVDVSIDAGPFWLLLCISLFTSTVSCVVSNNATVVLMFPICIKAQALIPSVPLQQFVVVLMMAASTSFLTPIGYQTNLMVQKPGTYTFGDFFKFGALLQLMLCFVSVGLVRLMM